MSISVSVNQRHPPRELMPNVLTRAQPHYIPSTRVQSYFIFILFRKCLLKEVGPKKEKGREEPGRKCQKKN